MGGEFGREEIHMCVGLSPFLSTGNYHNTVDQYSNQIRQHKIKGVFFFTKTSYDSQSNSVFKGKIQNNLITLQMKTK